ncbi:hypothetical protein ABZ370_19620 [Streptomyces sp. NPDC005962]|uniref:hypothetical protein n=1 Tax=Streptomyces sp. NPDC005962 TaxID=3154466 RepID=UPI0033D61110
MPLPFEQALVELLTSSDPPADPLCDLLADGPYVLCELGENHAGRHTDHLHFEHDLSLWIMWDDSGHQFVRMLSCEALSPSDEDACYFHQHHSSAHSWAVTDPARQALDEGLEGRYGHGWRSGD